MVGKGWNSDHAKMGKKTSKRAKQREAAQKHEEEGPSLAALSTAEVPLHKKTYKEKKKARKAQRETAGLVIGGKLRGCEGNSDIAFLEWLLSKGSLDVHALWAAYLRDYNIQVPYEMVPRSAHRPPNLMSQLKAVIKRHHSCSTATMSSQCYLLAGNQNTRRR